MLTELSITNLGLIRSTSLELRQGLLAISGETGAGKSMLLSAMHLLTGGRASTSAISKGATQLTVDSSWDLSKEPEDSALLLELEELGAELEDGTLHVSRTVKTDGKSRAVLGGRPTTAKALTGVMSQLLRIHGQSDQLKLKDPLEQLRILDSFGLKSAEAEKALTAYRAAYRDWKQSVRALKEVKQHAASKKRELAALNSFLQDYEGLAPEQGELESLSDTIENLKNHEEVRVKLLTAQEGLDSEDYSPLMAVESLTEELRKASTLDSTLEELYELGASVCEQLSQLSSTLSLQLDRSDEEALEELATASERYAELQALLKRNSVANLEELEKEYAEAQSALKKLAVYARPLAELEEEAEASYRLLAKKASVLTKLRVKAGEELASAVNSELSALAMGSSRFTVGVSKVEPTLNGFDEVGFLLQQSGQEAQPLASTASGGELSRVLLALELSVASTVRRKTYIFDEADAGIGGATALEVGKRLARLADSQQVLVVSHLAQVAAYADHNVKVVKLDDGKTVRTTVEAIADKDKPREIARMLSGVEDSESAREHAQELLANAQSFKQIFRQEDPAVTASVGLTSV